MKTDRELLELAAKAAGLKHIDYTNTGYDGRFGLVTCDVYGRHGAEFDPLNDDGDALRLAVKLQLGISIPPVVDGRVDVVTFYGPIISIIEYPENDDRNAATRRAIVRAAAAIGEGMK